MQTLEEIIKDGEPREMRRAIAVKMKQLGETKKITESLGISEKFVSKWKLINERKGAEALRLQHKGSKKKLREPEQTEVVEFISKRQTLSLEEIVEYVKIHYGVTYKSRQSYYDLLKLGRMSWHKTEKTNPKRDESQVQLKRAEIKKKLLGWKKG